MNMKKVTTITQLLAIALALVFGASTLCQAAEKSYIVVYKQPPGQIDKDKVNNLGGKVKRQFNIIKAMAVDLSEQNKAELQSDSRVAYVEEDITVTLVEPAVGGFEYENSWGVSRIGAFLAHENGSLGANVKVAVLDTGIDETHPDLDDNYYGGYDIVFGDTDPYDDNRYSHGTHVAGIVAAELNGAGVVGAAPLAELYAVKVLDGSGFGLLSWIIAGIDWAVANNMDIANMSFATLENSLALEEACQAAYDEGVLLVAAAGNYIDGSHGPVKYPAAYDSVIAVGGTNHDDTVLFESAVGPEIELAAPGLMVNSTVVGGYGMLTGTSQASPHVAGVAALLMGEASSDLNGDGIVDNQEVRQILQETALDLGKKGWDPVFGQGLVQASADSPQSPSFIEVAVGQKKKEIPENYPSILLDKGIFDLHISNDSLANLTIEVLKNGNSQDNLAEYISFGKKDPQEVILTIHANGQTFEVVFIPAGRRGSFATVEVEQLLDVAGQ
jgi:subtilisin